MPPKTTGTGAAGKRAGKAAGAKPRPAATSSRPEAEAAEPAPAAARPAKRPARRRAPDHPVKLGALAANGVAPAIYALIERGVGRRPKVAKGLRGTVEIQFKEGFAPVRIEFRPSDILVADIVVEPVAQGERPKRRRKTAEVDLAVSGSLPDIVHLASAPMFGGVPKLSDARGRAAITKVAGGQVKIEGSPLLARRVLKLLEI